MTIIIKNGAKKIKAKCAGMLPAPNEDLHSD